MSTVSISSRAGVICVLLMVARALAAPGAEGEQARAILDATGVRGGLVVHVGCGDGRLTAALAPNESCIVRGYTNVCSHITVTRSQLRA